MAKYLPEQSVLKPKNPSLKDDNDWESFTISNAEVRDGKTGEVCSLLMADALLPLTVTGNLVQVKKNQSPLLLRPEYSKSTPIRIENVALYSYGNDPEDAEDPEAVQIWAGGQAGWFKIKPGRAYKDIYKEMQESIELLWFAGDVYENHKRGGGGPSAEHVFREYAEADDTAVSSEQEARALFHKHRSFLLLAMINGKEGMAWGHNPLRNHLKTKYPDDFQAMMDKATLKEPEPIPRSQAKSQTRHVPTRSKEDNIMSDSKAAASRAPSSKMTSSRNLPVRPKRDENWFKARIVWEQVQRSEGDGTIPPNEMTIDKIAEALTRRYDIDDKELAANHIKAFHEQLRGMMEAKAARKTSGTNWTKVPLYHELKAPDMLAAILRKAQEVELRARKVPIPEPVASESESEAHDRKRRRGKTGRLSVLRPKGGKFSAKATGRRGKGPKAKSKTIQEGSDAGSEPYDPPSPGRRQTAEGGVLNNGEVPPSSLLKTPANQHDSDFISSDDDGEETPISSTISSPANITANSTLPLAWPDSNFDSALTATLRSQPLHILHANLPGDVWLCPHLGCNQKVFQASSEQSRLLMKEHYQTHEPQSKEETSSLDTAGDEKGVDRERLDLVLNEEQRSRLPVSNLIQRIRALAQAQGTGTGGGSSSAFFANGNGFPDPITPRT